MILKRDDIFLAQKKLLKQEIVEVPEWGGSVIVRALMAFEADVFEASFTDTEPSTATNGNGSKPPEKARARNFRARIAVLACIDEEGHQLFTEKDIEELGTMPRSALDRISTVAMKLSGYSKEDAKKNLPEEGVSSSDLH